MLTAAGIIGNLASLIAEKSASGVVALAFDKRKRACRALTDLYYCLEALDAMTERFLEAYDKFFEAGNARGLLDALGAHSYDLDRVSNRFIDLGFDLEAGLEIIDPPLARCCTLLYVSKFDFLTFLSQSIECDDEFPHRTVKIKRFRGAMENADLDAIYNETRKAIAAGDKDYWPTGVFDDFQRDAETITIVFDDGDAARSIRDLIDAQNKRIKQATEKLRVLIKDNFSIEEILYERASRPIQL